MGLGFRVPSVCPLCGEGNLLCRNLRLGEGGQRSLRVSWLECNRCGEKLFDNKMVKRVFRALRKNRWSRNAVESILIS